MLLTTLAPFALYLLSLNICVSAQNNAAAGVGKYIQSSATRQSIFSLAKVQSTVDAITSTFGNGPNRTFSHAVPVDKLYGVNFGNWLLSEPWMSPGAWRAMGGQYPCASGCQSCRQSEWSLSNAIGRNKTNAVFQQHWQNWFTQADVDAIADLGLNSVRLPLPFWIIEEIVDTTTEPYAQGGLDELIRGLTMLKNKGLHVVLDHHALPGVSSSGQMFAGNCTDQVHFYDSPNDANYKRAVTWSIVMAWLSHTHPAFETVFAIEAINEPEQNYAKTPGLDRFEKSFVLGIRAIEIALGIVCDSTLGSGVLVDAIARSALFTALPIILNLTKKYNLGALTVERLLEEFIDFIPGKSGGLAEFGKGKRCLANNFMNRDWQYSTTGQVVPNPADVAHGAQIYDNHLYFSFGGVADPNEDSYLKTICNLTRVETAAAISNTPLYFGEWSLATNFPSVTSDAFLKKWGDAQKLAYSKGAGWMFWNWKVDADADVPDQRMWSYRDAVAGGVMTRVPSAVFDVDVCAPYKNMSTTTTTAGKRALHHHRRHYSNVARL